MTRGEKPLRPPAPSPKLEPISHGKVGNVEEDKTLPRKTEEVYLKSEVEKDLLDRLGRIEGHLRGISRMLGEQKSCDDILIQIAAVRAAMTQVSIKLLEGHMDTCVREGILRGEGELAISNLRRALSSALKQF